MKLDESRLAVFDIPIVRLSETYVLQSGNAAFEALFDLSQPLTLTSLSADFNERRFLRKMEQGQSYSCRLTSNQGRPLPFWIEILSDEAGYIGFLIDASAIAKADAMMASYSDMIEKQNREIKRQSEQLALWSKRIKNELEQAETVQALLVPERVSLAGIDSRCVPLRELSGDFHDALTDDEGVTTFISGDVAGKGIYAAILLAQMLTAFRAYVEAPSLPALASQIVEAVEGKFPDGLFVALTLVRLSADKQRADVLNLGNPDALVINRDGVQQKCPAIGPAIGILPAGFYETLEVQRCDLSHGCLYVFSDGIIDFNRGAEGPFANAEEAYDFITTLETTHGKNALDHLLDIATKAPQDDDIIISRIGL